MATLNTFTESPNPVPSGQVGTVTVTFTTSAGTPDQTGNVQLFLDGMLVGTVSPAVTLKGTLPEATPTVQVGSTNSGWEIRTDQGVLTSLGSNKFSIAHS